jgi:hypothetical protein
LTIAVGLIVIQSVVIALSLKYTTTLGHPEIQTLV